MSRRIFATRLFVVLVALPLAIAPALAQGSGEAGNASGISAIFVFISGAALLVYSVEKLIGYLTRAAATLDVSLFLLAVIFCGIEFDDVVLGVVLGLEELDGVALGLVFGTALSLTGVTLALAAIIAPTEFDVPHDYILLFTIAPFVLLPFVLTGGAITFTDGVILVVIFLSFLAYILYRESESDTPVFRDSEIQETVDGGVVRSASEDMPFVPTRELSDVVWLGLSVLALFGLIIGAATMATGTKGIIAAYGIEGSVFGATFATAVLTIEDVFLTVEPIRRGAPEIGVGNVIGSVVFSVTAKLGVIALVGSIAISPLAITWHLPVLIGATVVAAYFIHTGRLKPWHGYTLLGLYIAYWVISFVLFGFVPAEA